MTKWQSRAKQRVALRLLSEDLPIVDENGGVLFMTLVDGRQIINVDGAYDLWAPGAQRQLRHGMDLIEALGLIRTSK